MAEQDFIISIRTTADLAGIRQTEAELRKLGVQVESVKAAGAGTGGVAGGGTLGGAAGALAATAAVAGVYHAIRDAYQQSERITEEVAKQVTLLDKASAKWHEIAISASDAGDIAKIANQALPVLDKMAEKARELNAEQVSTTQRLIEIAATAFQPLAGITGKIWQPFTQGLKDAQSQQQQLSEEAVKTAGAEIKSAEASTEAWERLKLESPTQSLAQLNAQLRAYQTEQAKANVFTKEGIEDYEFFARRIKTTEDRIKDRTRAQKEQLDGEKDFEKQTRKLTEALSKELSAGQEKRFQQSERQREVDQREARAQIGAAGSVAGAALANIQANRQAQIEQQRIAAEQRDLEDRRRRGAYGQTELGEAAFKGARQDFGPGKPAAAEGSAEIVRAINRLIDLWK